jgi:hypothetical protein
LDRAATQLNMSVSSQQAEAYHAVS